MSELKEEQTNMDTSPTNKTTKMINDDSKSMDIDTNDDVFNVEYKAKPSNILDSIHRRIEVNDGKGRHKGTIKYIGNVITSKNPDTIWFGIDWDSNSRGKHNGTINKDGKAYKYFTCNDNCGSFIKPIKANFGRSLYDVILDRFSLNDLENDLSEQDRIMEESNYKISFDWFNK